MDGYNALEHLVSAVLERAKLYVTACCVVVSHEKCDSVS